MSLVGGGGGGRVLSAVINNHCSGADPECRRGLAVGMSPYEGSS